MEIQGRTALVTGATGGLGAAVARGLAARGAKLVLTGRKVDVLERLATEIGGKAIPADIADPAQLDRLLAEAGELDIVIANAALPAGGPLSDFTVEEIDRALAVNLRSVIVLAKHTTEGMVRRGSGRFVIMNSLQGKVATAGSAIYSATKYGLRGFASALHQDLHGTGVGVSVVFPGFIREAGLFADSGAKLPPWVGTKSPVDVANAVVRAIERERLEVDVAPLGLRAGALFGGTFPSLGAFVTRKMGGHRIAQDIVAGQRDKRT
jgi:short-subunit dehydrogenase